MTDVAAQSRSAPTRATQPANGAERVLYLLGAGATQGCISYRGSAASLVMPGLIGPLRDGMRRALYSDSEYKTHPGLRRLVNEVVDENTDFEQLITFLGDARSAPFRRFSDSLMQVFSTVLRDRLDQVTTELGEGRSDLYAALVDMHNVPTVGEELTGFLTLNYDGLLEHAIEEHLGVTVDYGFAMLPPSRNGRSIPVMKLHGSFTWADQWPVTGGSSHTHELWIPPGIRKAKSEYPFNAIWGRARELLDCDVLRIVGCNLGPNDWDLVSMLFTTMHTHTTKGPFRVEVIAGPKAAGRIADLFPYLNVFSILELPTVGRQIVGEVRGSSPLELDELDPQEQTEVRDRVEQKVRNPFEYWLRLKGESMKENLPSLATSTSLFQQFIEGPDPKGVPSGT